MNTLAILLTITALALALVIGALAMLVGSKLVATEPVKSEAKASNPSTAEVMVPSGWTKCSYCGHVYDPSSPEYLKSLFPPYFLEGDCPECHQ